MFFDVTGFDVQYEMDLVDIAEHTGGTVAAAAASLERHSRPSARGSCAAPGKHGDHAFAAATMYGFLPQSGLVTRLKRSVLARASDAGS